MKNKTANKFATDDLLRLSPPPRPCYIRVVTCVPSPAGDNIPGCRYIFSLSYQRAPLYSSQRLPTSSLYRERRRARTAGGGETLRKAGTEEERSVTSQGAESSRQDWILFKTRRVLNIEKRREEERSL